MALQPAEVGTQRARHILRCPLGATRLTLQLQLQAQPPARLPTHLANVGGDHVADKGLHVVVDGSPFLHGSHNCRATAKSPGGRSPCARSRQSRSRHAEPQWNTNSKLPWSPARSQPSAQPASWPATHQWQSCRLPAPYQRPPWPPQCLQHTSKDEVTENRMFISGPGSTASSGCGCGWQVTKAAASCWPCTPSRMLMDTGGSVKAYNTSPTSEAMPTCPTQDTTNCCNQGSAASGARNQRPLAHPPTHL